MITKKKIKYLQKYGGKRIVNEKQGEQLQEVHDSVIQIEEHLKRLNGSVERHEGDINSNCDRINELEASIDRLAGAVKGVTVLAGVISILIGIAAFVV